ncbi:hypothetical protein VE01_07345 [Pseudogymnoascus verrucosus]|uniref:Alternative oxidase n=1 Tax=Pseudogymnoascus verrucosus TaxID=342668 RepID=A0A1B8GH06_9PEZI|nr:uncharacterized protein VE01_07345 [Pseudogymnoascus verrucosus]OBT95118.1 hypothetical protein VE01_07345 [Pseudogymnoascus verrucosus]
MYLGVGQRRCITLVLSAFIAIVFCASYWQWSGGEHVRLIPSFHDADVAGAGKGGVLTKPGTAKELSPDEVVLAEYDEAPIREMCANSSWADSRNVVVNCESRVGGVGNVRQEFLVCVRQAIEIGASLIRPNIMLRSEGLIEYQNGPVQNMSYLFNLELFDARLRSACPYMPIYNDLAEVEHVGEIARVDRPRNLPEEQGVQLSFTEWARLNRQPEGKITVITMPRITGQTPVCDDPSPFVANFGRLVEFRTDTQRLASTILSALLTRFSPAFLPYYGLANNTFIGLHFRTEIDAVNVGYTSFEEQTAAYLSFVSATPIRAIYAASGNTTSLSLFAVEAAKLNPPATVVAKGDLLEGKDKQALEALTWDQQALVDYLVLTKAAQFAGVSDSSFSWGIAYARQVVSAEAGTCQSVGGLEKGVQFRDELSTVFGRPRDWHINKLWP